MLSYSDAHWAGDANRWRSTSGYVFKGNYSSVSWSIKNQATIAKPSTEAECVSP